MSKVEPEQFDAVTIPTEPLLPVVFEVMAGPVVEAQKQLPTGALDELLEKQQERVAVEDGFEPIVEAGLVFEGNRPKDGRSSPASRRPGGPIASEGAESRTPERATAAVHCACGTERRSASR